MRPSQELGRSTWELSRDAGVGTAAIVAAAGNEPGTPGMATGQSALVDGSVMFILDGVSQQWHC